MIITLVFPFKLISKSNEKVFNARGRFFLSPKFKKFERDIAFEAKRQYRYEALTDDLAVTIMANFSSKKHCDIVNCFKSVTDALQKIAYKNDRQIKKAGIIADENAAADSFKVIIETL